MTVGEPAAAVRGWCLPGCDRLDGHDGRDAGACMRGGEMMVRRKREPAWWDGLTDWQKLGALNEMSLREQQFFAPDEGWERLMREVGQRAVADLEAFRREREGWWPDPDQPEWWLG